MQIQQLLDNECLDICDQNINMTVPWYIMAAYAYYVEDDPILSDTMFDSLAKKILKNWDTIEHFHKHHLNEDMLVGGTYLGDYPSRVEGAIKELKNIYFGKKSPAATKKKVQKKTKKTSEGGLLSFM